MTATVDSIKRAIMADPDNHHYTEAGIAPLFAAPSTAKILLIGQAPGFKTQEAGLYFKDRSGDRLRDWLGVNEGLSINRASSESWPWIFTFPVLGSLVICLRENGLQISGIHN